MRGTDIEINIKIDKTEVHTLGQNALAKMEHWLSVHDFSLLPCCWAHGYLWLFEAMQHSRYEPPS